MKGSTDDDRISFGSWGLELLFKSSNCTASVLAGDSTTLLSLQEASFWWGLFCCCCFSFFSRVLGVSFCQLVPLLPYQLLFGLSTSGCLRSKPQLSTKCPSATSVTPDKSCSSDFFLTLPKHYYSNMLFLDHCYSIFFIFSNS